MSSRLLDKNSLLLRITGLIALLAIPFKHIPRQVDDILPINSALTSHITSFILGFSLLYIAGQVARKKRSAFMLASSGLILLIVTELLHFHNYFQLGLYAVALASLQNDRRQYVVKSDTESFRRAAKTVVGLLLVVLTFSAILSSRVDVKDFGKDLSIMKTAEVFGLSLLSLPVPEDIHPHGGGIRIIQLLNVAGVTSGILIGVSLFKPLQLRRPAPRSHTRDARRIIEQYSTSTEDYLKLWPNDKHYFFYEDSFLAYKVANGVALILDGATGKPDDLNALRQEFLAFARGNGWSTAIIHADDQEAQSWAQYDMQKIFIGSEAAVDCQEFQATTYRDKHFRYVANRAQKDGVEFEFWEPPLNSSQVSELRDVSDQWLTNGKREYTFIMGYFEDDYITNSRVGVLKQNGTVVAYANLLPGFVARADSIDHMRAVPGISQVAMHYLLMQIILQQSKTGSKILNLGLAPLSKLEDQSIENLSDRVLPLLRLLGSRYYSFSGLEQFKGKFRPEWEARYIIYSGNATRLPVIMNALNSATAYKTK